ncbi:MAG: lipopolysaccharide biosynthesis protein [Betaproteobacteria bacterium]|nr:lipopolysaccharide biosynthesis protein [Betaproteobacteria bacterium]
MSDFNPMPAETAEGEISLLDLLQTVAENLRLLALGPLVVGLAALGISFVVAPTFTGKVTFLPPQQQQSSAAALLQSLGSLGGLASAAGGAGLKNPSDQFIAFLKSQTVTDAMVERFKLQERYEAKMREDARLALQGATRVTAAKDGLISIEVDDKDPAFAAELANAYVQELQKLIGRLALTEAQNRRVFFERKIQEAKTELAEADRALRSTGVSADTLKSSPAAAVESVARLKAGITAQEVKIGAMRGYLNDSAPEMRQALVELSTLRNQLRKAEKDEPVHAGKLEDSYVERFRDYKYKETLYDLFTRQYELARVDEAREGAVIQVVDIALPPERKSKPKKAPITMVATLAAGFALLLFVFIRQALRNAQQSGETAEKLARLRGSFRQALGLKG